MVRRRPFRPCPERATPRAMVRTQPGVERNRNLVFHKSSRTRTRRNHRWENVVPCCGVDIAHTGSRRSIQGLLMQRFLLRLAGSRRVTLVTYVAATAMSFFALGAIHARRLDAAMNASYEARLDSLRDEMQRALARESSARAVPTGTRGTAGPPAAMADDGSAASR